MKKEIEKKAILLVTGQIINMLTNNILEGNGYECFSSWCENGSVFFDMDGLTAEEKDAASELMFLVSPFVDNLTFNYLNLEDD